MPHYQVVQVEFALAVQVNHHRHIGAGACRAVVAAAQGFFVPHQVHGVDAGLLPPGGNADHGDHAALGRHIVGGFGGVAAAEHLKGVVGAAPAGQVFHLLHRILVGGVDGVGGAEAHCEFQLRLADVHGDNLPGAGQGGAHNHIQAYAAAADDGHGAAGPDFGAVQGGAHTGGYRAANHCRLVHCQRRADGHYARFGDDGVLGKAGHLAHMVDVLAAGVQAGGAVQQIGAGGGVQVAEVAVALQTGAAASAGRHEGQDDLVAFGRQSNAGAGLGHGAGAFVSEDDGDGDGGVAVHEVAVAAADAGGADFDQHFAGLRFVQVNLADVQGLAYFPQNGSFYLQNGCLLDRRIACAGVRQGGGIVDYRGD